MSASTLTRRNLLKGAAAAAPLFVPASVLGWAGQASANERVAMGFIGVGGRGSNLVNDFKGLKDAQCVAFADCHKSRREKWAAQLQGKAYADPRELVADKGIDAVAIATPDHWHVPAGLMAVRAGKDVYIEKPLGISVHHDQVMRDEVRKHKRMFQYGTQQRSSRHCRVACELVRNGKIGKVHTINVVAPNGREGGSLQEVPVPPDFDYNLWLGPAPMAPYTKDRCTNSGAWFCYDYAIGFIAGWGAHPLDLLVWGYDVHKAGKVQVDGKGVFQPTNLFNTVHSWNVNYTFANGLKMNLTHGENLTTFIGDQGEVRVSRSKLETEPKELMQADLGAASAKLVDSSNHAQNLVQAVKTRKDPVSFIEDAVRSDILSHLGDLAVRTGRKLTWDWEKEDFVGDAEASKMLKRPLRAPWTL
jgi:hypothetical protein